MTENKKKLTSLEEAYEHFEEISGKRNDYFNLKDDGDTAVVRFIHAGKDDLDWAIVHEVRINGKKRYVKCTQEDDCPLCRKGSRTFLKLLLQLEVDGKPDELFTWERGKTFVPKIFALINEYGDLYRHKFEIIRHGVAGDEKTTYEIVHLGEDVIPFEELPERQEMIGENAYILDKPHATLVEIANGTYNPNISTGEGSNAPVDGYIPPSDNDAPPIKRVASDEEIF